MVMLISDFIVDRECGWQYSSGEAIVLQSYGMRMQEKVPVRHDKRETRGPESVSTLFVAPTKHKETTVERAVSIYF